MQVKVILTSGKNDKWWDVIVPDESYAIKGAETYRRLGVFTSLQAVNDFLFTHQLERVEFAVDDTPKEIR